MRGVPILAVLALAASAPAAEKLLPRTMEVGKVGELWPAGRSAPGGSVPVRYIVTEVGNDWLALRVETDETTGDRMTILVRGIDTKGAVDDRPWKPTGQWRVDGTEKYKSSKTVFVLKPHQVKEKK